MLGVHAVGYVGQHGLLQLALAVEVLQLGQRTYTEGLHYRLLVCARLDLRNANRPRLVEGLDPRVRQGLGRRTTVRRQLLQHLLDEVLGGLADSGPFFACGMEGD